MQSAINHLKVFFIARVWQMFTLVTKRVELDNDQFMLLTKGHDHSIWAELPHSQNIRNDHLKMQWKGTENQQRPFEPWEIHKQAKGSNDERYYDS